MGRPYLYFKSIGDAPNSTNYLQLDVHFGNVIQLSVSDDVGILDVYKYNRVYLVKQENRLHSMYRRVSDMEDVDLLFADLTLCEENEFLIHLGVLKL